jgi:hypothetical protein
MQLACAAASEVVRPTIKHSLRDSGHRQLATIRMPALDTGQRQTCKPKSMNGVTYGSCPLITRKMR